MILFVIDEIFFVRVIMLVVFRVICFFRRVFYGDVIIILVFIGVFESQVGI
jgi:hypothetical protein